MNNISLNKEPINLCIGRHYIVMDAMYLNEVKEYLEVLTDNNLLERLKKIFPYNKIPFARILPSKGILHIEDIKEVDYDHIIDYEHCFATDSALILLICQDKVISFLSQYNYYDLIDKIYESNNNEVWKNLQLNFLPGEIALVGAPGVNSGCDFIGSGTYMFTEF